MHHLLNRKLLRRIQIRSTRKNSRSQPRKIIQILLLNQKQTQPTIKVKMQEMTRILQKIIINLNQQTLHLKKTQKKHRKQNNL